MRIVCDLDGVLASFESGYLKILRSIQSGIKINEYDPAFPAVWDWDKAAGYTDETIKRAWREIEGSRDFWLKLLPTSAAYSDVQALMKAKQMGADVYFCTTRPGTIAKAQTEEWLQRLGFSLPTVVVCDKKAQFCQSINASLIIDDKPSNLFDCLPTKRALVMREYNKEYWGKMEHTVANVREALRPYGF